MLESSLSEEEEGVVFICIFRIAKDDGICLWFNQQGDQGTFVYLLHLVLILYQMKTLQLWVDITEKDLSAIESLKVNNAKASLDLRLS